MTDIRFPAGTESFTSIFVQTGSKVNPDSYPMSNKAFFLDGKVDGA
jgi:hypothetical protein